MMTQRSRRRLPRSMRIRMSGTGKDGDSTFVNRWPSSSFAAFDCGGIEEKHVHSDPEVKTNSEATSG